MNLNVSPQIRVVVLAGLVALLGLAVLLFAFGHRSPSATPSTPTPTPGLVPATTHTGPAVHGHVQPAAQSRPVAKHAVKAPRVAPAVKAALAQGWPRVLADRFASR